MPTNGIHLLFHTYAHYNDAGTMVYETGRSPQQTFTVARSSSISYGFNRPTDTQLNRVRIYMTLAGGTVFYLEQVVTISVWDGTIQWANITKSDTTLDDQASAYLTNKGYENKRLYTDGVLPPLRYVIRAQQRLWGAGRMQRTGTNEDATLYWSELAPNWRDWPVVNANTIFGEPLTGLVEQNELVYPFTRNTRWRVTPNTYNAGITFEELEGGVGCVSHHTIVKVGGRLVWLAEDGFYATMGDGEPAYVSGDIEGTIRGLSQRRMLSAWAEDYDRERHEYRCHVTSSAEAINDLCLVFRTMDGINGDWCARWGFGRSCTSGGSIVIPGGKRTFFFGDHLGCVWQQDIGTSDGAGEGGTYQGTLSSATASVLTDSSAAFYTTGSGLRGAPVLVMDRDTGELIHARVYSNTGTALTLDTVLSRTPDAGDAYVVGGIPMSIESGDLTFGNPRVVKSIQMVTFEFEPQPRGKLAFHIAADQEKTDSTAWQFGGYVPLTQRVGYYRLDLSGVGVKGATGRAIRYCISAHDPNRAACLTHLSFTFDVRGDDP